MEKIVIASLALISVIIAYSKEENEKKQQSEN